MEKLANTNSLYLFAVLPKNYSSFNRFVIRGKRRKVSSAVRLDGPYAKLLGIVGAGGISYHEKKVNISQIRVSKVL